MVNKIEIGNSVVFQNDLTDHDTDRTIYKVLNMVSGKAVIDMGDEHVSKLTEIPIEDLSKLD